MTINDQLDLDAIDTAAAAATPGPWGTYQYGGDSLIEIAADLEETGTGYSARRTIARFDEEPLDNDPAHRGWMAEEDWAQVQADAAYIAAMSPDVAKALVAEVRRLRTDAAAELLPDWETMYEPGNVSNYLIGYANDEQAAKGAAEAWMRSQAEVTGRLEWVPDERLATGRYDRWFELVERHDDGVDTGPGIVVRRRLAAEAQQQEPAQGRCSSCDHEAQYHDVDGRCWFTVDSGVPGSNLVCPCAPRPVDGDGTGAQQQPETEAPDFVTRVLEIFSLSHADAYGDLFWRVDHGRVHLSANVSDVFAWGGADCEPITPDTLPVLEQAYTDLKALDAEHFTAELYAARRRGERPQGAAYPDDKDRGWREVSVLLDACGPERQLGLGNPKPAATHVAQQPAAEAWVCKCPAGLCGCGHHAPTEQQAAAADGEGAPS